MRLNELKSNERAAVEGDWVRDLPGLGDFAVRTKSITRAAAVTHINKLTGVILKRRSKGVPAEVSDYLYARALIDRCVTDWKNLTAPVDASGAINLDAPGLPEREIAFTPDNLAAILLEPGEIVTEATEEEPSRRYATPCGRRPRYAMREFLTALIVAASRVDEGAEDEPEPAQEKN